MITQYPSDINISAKMLILLVNKGQQIHCTEEESVQGGPGTGDEHLGDDQQHQDLQQQFQAC